MNTGRLWESAEVTEKPGSDRRLRRRKKEEDRKRKKDKRRGKWK